MKKTPSFRLWLFYGLLFLVGVALIDTYSYQFFAPSRCFEIVFWGTLGAAFVITVGQFLATIFYFLNKNRDRGFFHLVQFIVWLFITWLTFVINISFVGMGFHSVPIKE